MKNYKITKRLDLPLLEKEMMQSWKEEGTFQESLSIRKDSPVFVLYDGPPSANGAPGIHHVLSRTLKDIFGRYKTMQGYHVPRKGGWDTHGLPIELQAEKELGITKDDIGNTISVKTYNSYCKKIVMRYKKEWDHVTEKIGYWIDLDNPYITYETKYIEAVWAVLHKLYKKNLLYKGYTIQPYSPAAGTGLSTHELNQPGCYKEVRDTTIVVQFELKEKPGTYFLAWTTTPWTLPANSALAVNSKFTYLTISTFNRYTKQPIKVILSEGSRDRYLKEVGESLPMEAPKNIQDPLPWRLISSCKGSELIGTSYKQLMPYITPPKKAFYVVEGNFVTDEQGSGIVHIAPTFGADDYRLAQQKGIPSITVTKKGVQVPIVDLSGKYIEEMGEFAHKYVKNSYSPNWEKEKKEELSLDIQIALKLKKENSAFLVESYKHSYPHCWRTDKPILYYPLDSWFVRTTAYRDKLIEHNKTINWKPTSTGTGRFGNWLETLVDWNISRSRFWGTPLPIWQTKSGQEKICIGSIAQLQEEIKKAKQAGVEQEELPEPLDLHRPYVDKCILISSKGEKMYRQKEVIDVWFDSGAMPYAQNRSKSPLEKGVKEPQFPADFISEGVDQTRGWFFTLHALSVLLLDSVAYKNVLATGVILDKKGYKMSKRLGNSIAPIPLINEKGADAIRWYMIINSSPWDNLHFDKDGVDEVSRKFFSTLHHTYQFFALYANIDKFSPPSSQHNLKNATILDKWISSKLHKLIEEVRQAYNDYNPTLAARAIQHFVVEELSNWYVRLNRKRYWASGNSPNKEIAYHLLHHSLLEVTKLSAPIAPFYMDYLYRSLLQKDDSVHLTDFPVFDQSKINLTLEKGMDYAQKISSLAHGIRKKVNIKVRQPLSKLLIVSLDPEFKSLIRPLEDLISQEINVEKIEYLSSSDILLEKKALPNYAILGKKHGSLLPQIKNALNKCTKEELNHLEKNGALTLSLENQQITIEKNQVNWISSAIPGWETAQSKGITLSLDLKLTPQLKAKGWLREAINKIQNKRKEIGLEIEDKIELKLYSPSKELMEALQKGGALLQSEVQAREVIWLQKQTNNLSGTQIEKKTLFICIDKKNK